MNGDKLVFGSFGSRMVVAALVTAIVGALWLVLWLFLSPFLADHPEYLPRFEVLACFTLFFTFAVELSEGTICKYMLMIFRSFFFIVYVAYATDYGMLTMKIENLTLAVEFMPLLALIVAINLLAMSKSLLNAIEFTSQSPKD